MSKLKLTTTHKVMLCVGLLAAAATVFGAIWKSQPTDAQTIDNRGGIYAPNQSGGQNIINNGPPRERDGFYQKDKKIGQGQQAQVDQSGKSIKFGFAGFTAWPDRAAIIEYDDLRLSCPNVPTNDRGIIAAQISIAVAGLDCAVAGKR